MAAPIADRHRSVAAAFTDLLSSGIDLTAPTPVPEWTVADLVEHMIWFHDFVHAGSPFGWTRRRDPALDPVAAWTEQTAAVQNILDDSAQAESAFCHPNASGTTLGEATARFYVADVFMHSLDLARALRSQIDVDESYALELLEGMQHMEDVIRSSGQFGIAQRVDPNAAPSERLMAFIGRDPQWSPA